MKYYFIGLLLLFLSPIVVKGQDIIYLKDGTQIIAKDIKINDNSVKYKEGAKCPDGSVEYDILPKYTSSQLVDYVVYSEGDTLFLNPSYETIISSKLSKQNNYDSFNQICYPRYKNPALAYFCSLIPGGGQFYNDEIGIGFAYMISTGVCAGATYAFNIAAKDLFNERTGDYTGDGKTYAKAAIAFGVATAVLYLWQSIDAVITADKKNKMNGYVMSLAPSIMDNHFAEVVGGSEYVPAMSFNLTF